MATLAAAPANRNTQGDTFFTAAILNQKPHGRP